MSYKDILIYADAAKAGESRLNVAAVLAKAHKAHITALHVAQPPYIPMDVGAAGVPPEVIEWQEDFEEEQTKAARKAVEAFRKRSKLAIEWRVVRGDMAASVAQQARYSDLVVVSQAGAGKNEAPAVDDLPEAVVLDAGCPALIVPRNGHGNVKTVGSRVLIAWNQTREAARAVHDAMPFLERAKAVLVMEANVEKGDKLARTDKIDIIAHLARHGVKAKLISVKADDVGKAILSKAKGFKADLIVMGAYGHSRLREYVMGGVTRHVLGAAEAPVLMSH